MIDRLYAGRAYNRVESFNVLDLESRIKGRRVMKAQAAGRPLALHLCCCTVGYTLCAKPVEDAKKLVRVAIAAFSKVTQTHQWATLAIAGLE